MKARAEAGQWMVQKVEAGESELQALSLLERYRLLQRKIAGKESRPMKVRKVRRSIHTLRPQAKAFAVDVLVLLQVGGRISTRTAISRAENRLQQHICRTK